MIVSLLNLEKFTLIEGDEYFTTFERKICFRRTDKRFTALRKYLSGLNSLPTKKKRKFTFTHNTKEKIVTILLTEKNN